MPAKPVLPEDIHPLTDFLRRHKEHLRQLKRNRRPMVLTRNGRAAVVVQDAAAYQALLEEAETIAGIRDGLASMKAGRGVAADAALATLRAKHGLKRRA